MYLVQVINIDRRKYCNYIISFYILVFIYIRRVIIFSDKNKLILYIHRYVSTFARINFPVYINTLSMVMHELNITDNYNYHSE